MHAISYQQNTGLAVLPKSRYSPTKSNTLTASRQNGQKLQRVFTPHTGRSGNQFGRARAFCAKRADEARHPGA